VSATTTTSFARYRQEMADPMGAPFTSVDVAVPAFVTVNR
jgi:hypothetical protein